jgi:hypothetical protein
LLIANKLRLDSIRWIVWLNILQRFSRNDTDDSFCIIVSLKIDAERMGIFCPSAAESKCDVSRFLVKK